MLYLGIDQHARQITISLRNDDGDVQQARQVSTHPEKIQAFFQQLTRDRLQHDDEFIAVLEVCGFNDWLIRMLQDYRCQRVILIQPDDRKKRKTDRRDAAALSELLWVNRDRLLAHKPVRGLRQVDIAASTDQANRRLTTLRKEAREARTRVINKIRHILRRHNLQWQMPTKTFPTKPAIAWLQNLVLPEIDRLEMNHLLTDLDHVQQRHLALEKVIGERCGASQEACAVGVDAGSRSLHRHGSGLPCRSRGALSPFAQSGQLLGTHAGLPQQWREQSATGKHHESRQQHGQVAARPSGSPGLAKGRAPAGVVQTDQTPAGRYDRTSGRDEKAGHDYLAHAEETKDVCRVS